jgi:site-specific recombinase XerC
MADEIIVTVASAGPGRALSLCWRDPVTGKRRLQSSGTLDEKKAIGKAAVLQDELNSGRFVSPSRITWEDFCQKYEAEKLTALAPHTAETARGALAHVARVLNPGRLAAISPTVLSRFQADLRKEGMKETTIAKVLRHLKAALRWGEKQGLLRKAPAIEMPKGPKGQSLAKSRPIAGEEAERLLLAVPKVRPDDAPAWVRFINGLWLSGLRLGEAAGLSWDLEAGFRVDFHRGRPVLVIRGGSQKSRKDEVPARMKSARSLRTLASFSWRRRRRSGSAGFSPCRSPHTRPALFSGGSGGRPASW